KKLKFGLWVTSGVTRMKAVQPFWRPLAGQASTRAGISHQRPCQWQGGALAEKRQVNESGIEQTVVAFDVKLKTPTSRQGTAAFTHPQGWRSLGEPGCSTPHASGLGCGVFFANGVAGPYSRRQLLANAAMAASRAQPIRSPRRRGRGAWAARRGRAPSRS